MISTLRIPSSFGASDAAPWFDQWRSACDDRELQLFLSGDTSLRPSGVVLLAAGVADRQDRELGTQLATDLPGCAACVDLREAGFFSELGVVLDQVFERPDPSGALVPLRRIVDLAVARRVADETAAVLERELPDVGPSPLRMARFILEELGANIVQHTSRPRTGFGMARAFPDTGSIEIAFADAGVGFLSSLQRHPELAGRLEDEGEALQLALGRGLTGRPEGRGHMGMGLDLLVTFSDLLGGDLRVASGDALLHRRTVAGRERVNSLRRTSGWKGSWICLEAQLV